ncbi:hypothetical protein [Brucella pseudogrignonensis]|uniref:hypothetical protein n=1 Tax=Brucella pseudogrignonensis TaxID=419475 RepID=UPI003D950F71
MTMKFWGARIVERLFRLKEHKINAEVEDDRPPVKNSVESSPPQPRQLFRAETPASTVQKADDNSDKPAELITAPELPTRVLQKEAQQSNPEPSNGRDTNTAERLVDDNASDEQSAVSKGARTLRHSARKPDSSTTASKKPSKAKLRSRASLDAGKTDNPVLKSHEPYKDLDQAEVSRPAVPDGSKQVSNRSGKQKFKPADEPVTDKELAELEAENARLKRLLEEELNSRAASQTIE